MATLITTRVERERESDREEQGGHSPITTRSERER